MSAQAHGHSLWLVPRGAAATRLATIIEDLSHAYRTPSFPPHVTLLARVTQPAHEVVLRTRSMVSAEKLRRFQLRLGSLDTTRAYFRSLFIRADPSTALLTTHTRASTWFGVAQTEEFLPHLSLLYGELADKDKRSIIARLDRDYPAGYIAREIAIYATEGAPENWRLVESVALA
jgi:hypothetical protein